MHFNGMIFSNFIGLYNHQYILVLEHSLYPKIFSCHFSVNSAPIPHLDKPLPAFYSRFSFLETS